MPSRDDIVKEALEWIDTPFKHNQAAKGVGCDCVGLVYGVAKPLGIQFPEPRHSYPKRPDGTLTAWLNTHLKIVSEPLPGDVLLIAMPDEPCHVALYIGNGEIVHCYASIRKCVHQSVSGWWTRVRGVYRFPELIDG